MNETLAKLRSSQLVTTFGIGSIVDAPECSVMIAGQDFWDLDLTDTIHEPRLQKKLNVAEFRTPKACRRVGGHDTDPAIPAVRFPLWHFCPSCRRLAEIREFGGVRETVCRACSEPKNPKQLVPARFVVACEDGHISDFPWYWWVHRNASCVRPELEISTSGRSTTLSSISVSCRTCKRSETLEKIFEAGQLAPVCCQGTRP